MRAPQMVTITLDFFVSLRISIIHRYLVNVISDCIYSESLSLFFVGLHVYLLILSVNSANQQKVT